MASRLYWNAPSSGERYVAVEGYDIGTFTLTVSLSDVIDDHANSEGDATAIRVGADVRGALDYDGDIDFFRFQAEQGQSYQIDVALGTLDDSIVEPATTATGRFWIPTTTTGIPWPRASIGTLLVPASATLRWRATA